MKGISRVIYFLIGIALILAGFWLWFSEKQYATGLAAVGLGFLAFIFYRSDDFKSIKAFGMEAVFWKNKRKEIEKLLALMRTHLKIVAKEILSSKTKMGRWGSVAKWNERWQLYDSLLTEGKKLNKKYELDHSKEEMESYFLFDAIMPRQEKIQQALNEGQGRIQAKINEEFGSPTIKDIEGHNVKMSDLRSIHLKQSEDLFQLAKRRCLAKKTLEHWKNTSHKMMLRFKVEVTVDKKVIEELERLSVLETSNPIDRDLVMKFIEDR